MPVTTRQWKVCKMILELKIYHQSINQSRDVVVCGDINCAMDVIDSASMEDMPVNTTLSFLCCMYLLCRHLRKNLTLVNFYLLLYQRLRLLVMICYWTHTGI